MPREEPPSTTLPNDTCVKVEVFSDFQLYMGRENMTPYDVDLTYEAPAKERIKPMRTVIIGFRVADEPIQGSPSLSAFHRMVPYFGSDLAFVDVPFDTSQGRGRMASMQDGLCALLEGRDFHGCERFLVMVTAPSAGAGKVFSAPKKREPVLTGRLLTELVSERLQRILMRGGEKTANLLLVLCGGSSVVLGREFDKTMVDYTKRSSFSRGLEYEMASLQSIPNELLTEALRCHDEACWRDEDRRLPGLVSKRFREAFVPDLGLSIVHARSKATGKGRGCTYKVSFKELGSFLDDIRIFEAARGVLNGDGWKTFGNISRVEIECPRYKELTKKILEIVQHSNCSEVNIRTADTQGEVFMDLIEKMATAAPSLTVLRLWLGDWRPDEDGVKRGSEGDRDWMSREGEEQECEDEDEPGDDESVVESEEGWDSDDYNGRPHLDRVPRLASALASFTRLETLYVHVEERDYIEGQVTGPFFKNVLHLPYLKMYTWVAQERYIVQDHPKIMERYARYKRNDSGSPWEELVWFGAWGDRDVRSDSGCV
ncbi:hypothetical protein NMY22_g16849 [Coprinellus aureogranulatus]|nr:hypothetical protein NMY22_g16849 [Coprinellus aureogranulatus]